MHRLVSSFEILAEAFAHHCGSDLGQLPALAENLADDVFPLGGSADSSVVVGVIQGLLLRFLEDGWHVICLPPGSDYRNLPVVGWISRATGSADSSIASHWLTVTLDREGRRPGSLSLRTAAESAKEFLRTCAVIKCQLTHGVGIPDEVKAKALSGLSKSEEGLIRDNPANLRQFVRTLSHIERDALGQSFFGAIWDLLDVLSRTSDDPVAAGTWRFPDLPQRALRSRVAILEDATRAFLVPATFRTEVLRLHVLEWMTISPCPNAEMLETLIDAIAISHSLWMSSTAFRIREECLRSGVIRGRPSAVSLQRALSGESDVHLPPAVVARVGSFLTRTGHTDWTARLYKTVQPVADIGVADHLLARRLRGLRILGGMTLRDAAGIVGISRSRASYLINKKYRLDHLDHQWVERDVARLVHSRNGAGDLTLVELMRSGIVDETVFDSFESLQQERAKSIAERGRDE